MSRPIDNDLAAIKNAVYGEQVRDSIVSAIQKCYDDSTASAQIEAIEAKGAEVLDSIPDTYEDLQNDVDDLNSAVTEVSDLQAITPIWNPLNQYISYLTGTGANSNDWKRTDFLALPQNTIGLYITVPVVTINDQYTYVASVAFYTSNLADTFISSARVVKGNNKGYTEKYITVPPTAKYIRCSCFQEYVENFTAKASVALAKQSNITEIETAIADIESNVDDVETAIDNLETDIAEKDAALFGAYSYDGEFTANAQIINTGIALKAGMTYTITPTYTYNDFDNSQINAFTNGSGGSSEYVRLFMDGIPKDLHCKVDGYLCLYNLFNYTGSIRVDVVSNISRFDNDDSGTYYVGSAEKEKSLTALLLRLKNDKRNKTIIIRGGNYDIFSEYKALQQSGALPTVPTSGYDPSTGYLPYNVFVPENTHIIGEGLVRLNYLPTVSQTFVNETKTLSPLNVAGTCTIENIEIHCKNGRYCIHDDPMQDPAYSGAIKKYINIHSVKYVADDPEFGTTHNFGCGIAKDMRIEFDNCYFETKSSFSGARTLYIHNRAIVGGVTLGEKDSSNVVVKNSIIKSASHGLAVYLANIGAENLNIRVDIDSCYIDGNIVSADEGTPGTSGNNPNSFNIRTLLSKYNDIIILDEDNPYTPQEFNME